MPDCAKFRWLCDSIEKHDIVQYW